MMINRERFSFSVFKFKFKRLDYLLIVILFKVFFCFICFYTFPFIHGFGQFLQALFGLNKVVK